MEESERAYVRGIRDVFRRCFGITINDMCLPTYPGVYIILEINPTKKKFDVIYIGSSKNIYKRLYKGNHRADNYLENIFGEDFDESVIRPVFYIKTDNYLNVEINLIRTLSPLLNIHHNGQKDD